MATPSPKRRRLSATPSGARTPGGSARPSFMSPTKASIARFNPNLLQLRPSSSSAIAGAGESEINEGRETAVERARSGASTRIEIDEEREGLASTPGLFVTPAQPETQRNRRETDMGTPSRVMEVEADRGDNESRLEETGLEDGDESLQIDESEMQLRQSRGGQRERSSAPEQNQDEARPPRPEPQTEERITRKRKERDDLLQELRRVRRDLKQFEAHLSSNTDTTSKSQADSLLALVQSIDANGENTQEVQQPPNMATILTSFLPFSRKPPRQSQPDIEEKEEHFSHRPIDLENPLPYLNLFTSLSYTEEIEPAPECLADSNLEPFKEVHRIKAHSPLSVFGAVLRMEVTPTLRDSLTAPLPDVTSIEIEDVTLWTHTELLPVITKYAKQNDISALCNALDTYWDMCVKRVECWARCEEEFKHLLKGTVLDDKENDVMEKKGKKGSRKGSGRAQALDETSNSVSTSNQSTPGSLSRACLIRHLGRDHLVLKGADFSLRISWRIQFDWNGEAESLVQAEPKFPAAWAERDERKSLKDLPGMFKELVKKRGVFEGMRVLVGLLG